MTKRSTHTLWAPSSLPLAIRWRIRVKNKNFIQSTILTSPNNIKSASQKYRVYILLLYIFNIIISRFLDKFWTFGINHFFLNTITIFFLENNFRILIIVVYNNRKIKTGLPQRLGGNVGIPFARIADAPIKLGGRIRSASHVDDNDTRRRIITDIYRGEVTYDYHWQPTRIRRNVREWIGPAQSTVERRGKSIRACPFEHCASLKPRR